jgi:hypothetical protein
MYIAMVPCSGCTRHVRVNDNACPFCGTVVSATEARIVPDAPRRITRAAAFLFGAAVAVTACGDDEHVGVPVYGAPAVGGGGQGADGGQGGEAGQGGNGGDAGMGGMGALYGAPGGFGGGGSGPGGGGGAAGEGGTGAEYGAPPPPNP